VSRIPIGSYGVSLIAMCVPEQVPVTVVAGTQVRSWHTRQENCMARPVQIGAVVLLVVAATFLPWATYRSPDNQTTIFRGGTIGLVLVALGAVFIAVSLVSQARGPRRLNALVAVTAIVVSVGGALNKIRAANDAASHAAGGGSSQTSYAFGAILAVLATSVIVISAFIDLSPAGWNNSAQLE
jgi:hypothetical protein